MGGNLIYSDLSYQIIGILYDVYNTVGFGHPEKYYQKAIAIALKTQKIKFSEQVYAKVLYKNETIGKSYLDFIIEEKLILEIKKNERFSRSNIEQLYNYLVSTHLKLGILANFTRHGVKCKRIINIK